MKFGCVFAKRLRITLSKFLDNQLKRFANIRKKSEKNRMNLDKLTNHF